MTQSLSRSVIYLAQILALACAYGIAAKVGLLLVPEGASVSAVWPPAGIALAALLRCGRNLWPGVALGAALASDLDGAHWLVIGGGVVGSTLEAWVGATWLKARGFDGHSGSLRDVLSLVLRGALICSLISAWIGVAAMDLAGAVTPSAAPGLLLSWWAGDAMGVLLVAPPLLVLSTRPTWLTGTELLELAVASAVAALATLWAFGVWHVLTGYGAAHPVLLYLPVLGLMWVGVRFGVGAAAWLLLVVNGIALAATDAALGPFAGASPDQGLFQVWTFMGAASISILIAAALVTERRRAAEALRVSQSRLRNEMAFTDHVLDSLPGVFYLVDESGRLRRWNRLCEELSGLGPAEVRRRDVLDFFAERDRGRAMQAIADVHAQGASTLEAHLVGAESTEYTFLLSGRLIAHEGQRYLLGVGVDVSERERAEAELRRKTETLQRIIDSIPIMILFIDSGHRVQMVNREWQRVMGWTVEEINDDRIFSRLYPDPAERRAVIEHLTRGDADWGEYRSRARDGRSVDVAWTATRLSDGTMVGIGQDVTALKRTREALLQTQKLESIGRLSAGIAHDFNNLLVPILGFVDAGIERLPADSDVRRDLLLARKAAERAAELTRQILAFSRQQVLELQVIDLNAVVAEFRGMLDRLLGETIAVRVTLADDLPLIKADVGQIEQILMNLALNARDAMPDGGTLEIETAATEAPADGGQPDLEPAAAGPGVRLTVRDDGVGMDETALRHAFEPFYTSKAVGHGTGLGLAMVFGIVKQHGGHVEARSRPGEGACFDIVFPATAEQPRSAAGAGPRAPGVASGGTVLVVEDEPLVRRMVCDGLRAHGYRVIEAEDGEDAVDRARRLDTPLDLLLTDVVMPGLGGREVREAVSAHHPEAAVLFMSGYAEGPHPGAGADGSAPAGFLAKPFTVRRLAAEVARMLDGRATGGSGPAAEAPAGAAGPLH